MRAPETLYLAGLRPVIAHERQSLTNCLLTLVFSVLNWGVRVVIVWVEELAQLQRSSQPYMEAPASIHSHSIIRLQIGCQLCPEPDDF